MLLVLLIPVLAGCSGLKTEKRSKDIPLPQKVRVGVINSKALPPQVVYGFQKEIYKKQFPVVDFELVLSKGHHDVAKKMASGEWDLMYLGIGPAIEFVNYGYDEYKPAQYTILAGAQFGASILMVKPDIKSAKDLDGKTVGITNKNHDKEMLLNKLLAKEGLKTTSLGGTVKVKYAMPAGLFEEFQAGKIQAFYPMPSMVESLKQSGAKVLSDGSETEFGKEQTFAVLAVNNQFLEKYPAFIKEMVSIHVDATTLAQKNFEEMVDLTYELETVFFNGDPKRVIPKSEITKIYKRTQTTYDPNLKYLVESYRLLEEAKYIKALPAFEKWADFTMLNEVLKEKGLEPIN